MDTLKARIAREEILSRRQFEIVVGSLLGDAYLVKTTRGYAFRVNHGLAQKAYVDWKYSELEEFTNSKPRQSGKCYYFRTVSHPSFLELQEIFYDENRKIIPCQLEEWLSPLVLAVWLMDDGTKEGNQVRINTQSFSREENEMLIDILKAKLGIVATLNRDKNYYRLRVSANSMQHVKHIVAPHFIPSMHYKLSL